MRRGNSGGHIPGLKGVVVVAKGEWGIAQRRGKAKGGREDLLLIRWENEMESKIWPCPLWVFLSVDALLHQFSIHLIQVPSSKEVLFDNSSFI